MTCNTVLKRRSGFALVITLIMLVLAAIIVIALLSSATLERGTSKSVNDRYNADLAVQNGLEAAKKALVASPSATPSITGDDAFLVVRVDAPAVSPTPATTPSSYYYLAKAQPRPSSKIDYYPLFAGGGPTTDLSINLASMAVISPTPPPNPDPTNPGNAAIDVDTNNRIIKVYPAVPSWTGAPNTKWIEIRDPNDTATAPAHTLPYQRYTFWIEDLAGYVDASVAGNVADAGKNKRPLDQSTAAKRYKTSPDEIALFTIFDSTPAVDPGNTVAQNLIQNRPLQFTVPTLKQIAPGAGNMDVTSSYFAARAKPDSEQALVPFGYGYQDEGDPAKPQIDLSVQVQSGGAAAVQAIATKINDNLPTFGTQRKGGLTNSDYVKTIAASMIDYADADSSATAGSDYRGYDSYPLMNEIFSRKWWTATHLNSATNTYFVTISMDTWVELWNPSNQVISGTASINILENFPVQAGSYTYSFGISDIPNSSTVATTYPSGSASISVNNMQPNEYTTHHLRTDVFDYNTGVSPPLLFPAPSPASQKLPLTASLASNYELTWTGSGGGSAAVVDKAGGGVQRLSGSLDGPPNYSLASHKNWRGSYTGFGYSSSSGTAFTQFNNPGDPRASFYIGSGSPPGAQVAIAYDEGSSFWVRNYRSNVSGNPIYKEVKPSAWPDTGHDTPPVNTSPGNNSTVDPPTSRPANAATQPTKAPATISNFGSYFTAAEIANVYDPGQWNIPTDTNNHWTDITAASQSDYNYGGGYALRIGRPEFSLFDKPGVRAWQLLDLLHAGNRVDTRGLININTASRDVLRALGAGVLLNRDPDISFAPPPPATGFYPPFNSKQADLFADAIISARPFLSAAQISGIKIAGDPRSLFGNPAAWTASAPTEWNDSGTEEYFTKLFPLTTTRSRNFRVFVTGQSLDKNGRVLSTVNKVYQLFLNPTRDSSGKITRQNIELTYEAQLPL